jgi:hypothetical protein
VAQQGSPPRRSSRQPGSGHHSRADAPERAARPRRERPDPPWRDFGAFAPDDDSDLPPWAEPSVYRVGPGGTQLRPPRSEYREGRHGNSVESADEILEPAAGAPGAGSGRRPRRPRRHSRAAKARLRKSRRRVYRWGGIAIVACIAAAGIAALVTRPSPKPPLPYVTQLLPGEFKSVPDACTAVSAAVLDSVVPASGRVMTQTPSGGGESQCSFTFDKKPDFLVLEVTAQAFQPFAAASGNGSASQNALDNFDAARTSLAHPPKHSPVPPATITKLPGTGQQAFLAFQAETGSGTSKIDNDVVTVTILERNVVVTVSLQGQESGHGFGPVSPGTLEAGARTVASTVLAKVKTQPTA